MNKMTIVLSALVIAMSATNLAAAAEPTEAEMLSALKRKLGAYEGNVEKLKGGCATMNESQNPNDALSCMMGQFVGMAKISITDFEKVGCGPARAGGYICDYTIRISSGGMLGPIENLDTSEIITKRFIKTKNGWVVQ